MLSLVLNHNNKNYLNNLNSVFLVLNYQDKRVLMEELVYYIHIYNLEMFKDCASPGRSKISKEKDLHKIALKNSFRFY